MTKLFNLFVRLHETFFENDMDNKVVMGIGFGASAAVMLATIGLYML